MNAAATVESCGGITLRRHFAELAHAPEWRCRQRHDSKLSTRIVENRSRFLWKTVRKPRIRNAFVKFAVSSVLHNASESLTVWSTRRLGARSETIDQVHRSCESGERKRLAVDHGDGDLDVGGDSFRDGDQDSRDRFARDQP